MVYAALQNARMLYCINKNEGDESLSFSFLKKYCQCHFPEIFKVRQVISSHAGIWNAPSDVCDDDTKHYMVPSKKQGRCKVCKKEYPRPLRKIKHFHVSSKSAWYMFWNISWILANIWMPIVRFENVWISFV